MRSRFKFDILTPPTFMAKRGCDGLFAGWTPPRSAKDLKAQYLAMASPAKVEAAVMFAHEFRGVVGCYGGYFGCERPCTYIAHDGRGFCAPHVGRMPKAELNELVRVPIAEALRLLPAEFVAAPVPVPGQRRGDDDTPDGVEKKKPWCLKLRTVHRIVATLAAVVPLFLWALRSAELLPPRTLYPGVHKGPR